jgi:WD40 repeat protein
MPVSKHVSTAAFSWDNKLLVTGYAFGGSNHQKELDPNTFDLWDVPTGARISAPGSWSDPRKSIYNVAFVPNCSLILAAGFDQTLALWDVRRQRLVQVLDADPQGLPCVAVARDGKLAASAHGRSHLLKIWDLQTRKTLRSFTIARPPPRSLVMSPDSKLVCIEFIPARGESSTAELRSVIDGRLVRSFPRSERWGSPMAFSPDGKCIIMSKRHVAVLLDVATGTELQSIKITPKSVTFAGDVLIVVFGGPTSSATLSCWDTRTGREVRSQSMSWWNVFVFSSDGQCAFSAEGKESPGGGGLGGVYPIQHMTLSLWNATTGKQLYALMGPSRPPK